ncbi:potassium channel family protein [Halosegnis sp.]|uniref:potassium channel family protein n=1 Tax=Halosegnis sp. TaxID=2864959 RepID=UPI0035D51FE1
MRFVIVGAGRVGLRTARVLREEGHEVTVVESDATKADRLRSEGFDVIEGDGAEKATLVAAGVEGADAVGALTGDFETNILACTIGKGHGCRTVLRVTREYHEDTVRQYASDIDEVVYPERLGAVVAKNALLGGSIRAIADIAQNLQITELTVTESSPMRGYSLDELELPADSQVLAFGKADGSFGLPDEDYSLAAGDRVVVLADYEHLSEVRQIIVGGDEPAAVAGGAT